MKPKSVEVYPIYTCPECEARHVESLEYVKKVGKILCYCSHLMTLDKIKTFNITPVYLSEKKEKPKTEKKKRNRPKARKTRKQTQQIKCITKEASEQCVELLTSLGWTNRESKAKISKVSKEWSEQESKNIDHDNCEEFVNYLLFNEC